MSESDFAAPESAPASGPRLVEQDSLGNSAMLDRTGLRDANQPGGDEPDVDIDLGATEVDLGGASATPPPPGDDPVAPLPTTAEVVAPIEPPRAEVEAIQPEIREAGQFAGQIPAQFAAGDVGEYDEMSGYEGMGDSGWIGEFGETGEMQGFAEGYSTQIQPMAKMTEDEFAAYEQQTYDIVNNSIVEMSTDEKRSTLADMGYSGQAIDMMSPTEKNEALAGVLNKVVRSCRIQGMSTEEITRLPANEQRQFLIDLGVPAADAYKAEDRYIQQAVLDVVAVATTPGHHNIVLTIRGGWLRGKSYDINLEVSDEGHLADVDIEKRGGFFSKLGGLIKMALPVIAKLLAGFTGGLSLLALGIYNAVEAARNGDWLGAIASVAGGFVGAGFDGLASVADKVGSIANSAVRGLQAIKDGNIGGIIGAFASGAEAFASFAADQAGSFATTAREWAENARTWGGIAVGGVAVFQAIRGRDPLAAISASLNLVVSVRDRNQGDMVGPPTSLSNNPGVLVTGQRLAGFAVGARDAVTADPPQFGIFASNIFDMAAEYTDSGKIETGRNLSIFALNLEDGVRTGDWSAVGQAVLNISETIELASGGEDLTDEEREVINTRYGTAAAVVIPGLETVEAVSTGNWAAAISSGLATAKGAELARAEPADRARIDEKYATADLYLAPSVACADALATGDWSGLVTHASSLAGLLSRNGTVDKAAEISGFAGTLATHIEDRNVAGVRSTAKELWEAIQDLWGDADAGPEAIEARTTVPAGVEASPAPVPSPEAGGTPSQPRPEGPAGDPKAMKRALCAPLIDLHPTGLQYLVGGGPPSVDYGGATQSEGELVIDEMMGIPLGGIQEIHLKQTTVTVCHDNVTIARPDFLDDPKPRNWPAAYNWTDVPGVYDPTADQTIIATQDGQIPQEGFSHGSGNLVVHEVGHAIDAAVDGENDPAFIEAREKDYEFLSAYEREHNGGAQESYAESMARFYGQTPSQADREIYQNLFAYWRTVPLRPLW